MLCSVLSLGGLFFLRGNGGASSGSWGRREVSRGTARSRGCGGDILLREEQIEGNIQKKRNGRFKIIKLSVERQLGV